MGNITFINKQYNSDRLTIRSSWSISKEWTAKQAGTVFHSHVVAPSPQDRADGIKVKAGHFKLAGFYFHLKHPFKCVYVCVRIHTWGNVCTYVCASGVLHFFINVFLYFKRLLISFQGAGIDSITDKIYRIWEVETVVQSQDLMN